jgi:hypothetical protein
VVADLICRFGSLLFEDVFSPRLSHFWVTILTFSCFRCIVLSRHDVQRSDGVQKTIVSLLLASHVRLFVPQLNDQRYYARYFKHRQGYIVCRDAFVFLLLRAPSSYYVRPTPITHVMWRNERYPLRQQLEQGSSRSSLLVAHWAANLQVERSILCLGCVSSINSPH